MKAVELRITGKVQGVFFRKYTRDKAQELGIKGWVKNMEDGSVLVKAEGDENDLESLISWCHKGSPEADVDEVHTKEISSQQFNSFQIRR